MTPHFIELLGSFVLGAVTSLGMFALTIAWLSRRHRKLTEAALNAQVVATRGTVVARTQTPPVELKGKVIRVGGIIEQPDGSLTLLEGWNFDVTNGCPINAIGPDNVPRYCGYTAKELRELHAHRLEFNV